MKIKDLIPELGISQKTFDLLEVSVAEAINLDEFHRPKPRYDPNPDTRDYRELVIDRLIKSGIPFSSEFNIFWDLAKRYIKIVCPYCGKDMEYYSGGGSAYNCSVDYRCECGAKFFLSAFPNGMGINPPEQKKEVKPNGA